MLAAMALYLIEGLSLLSDPVRQRQGGHVYTINRKNGMPTMLWSAPRLRGGETRAEEEESEVPSMVDDFLYAARIGDAEELRRVLPNVDVNWSPRKHATHARFHAGINMHTHAGMHTGVCARARNGPNR